MTKILKNFNLFVDGRGYAGKVEDVAPPKLTTKIEEFRAGGMDVPTSIDMGMEKLEASFSLVEFSPEIIKQFGLVSNNSVQITLRGAMVDNDTTSPVVINLRGMLTEIDMGTFKAGDKPVMKCNIACCYYKFEIDGEVLVEIDVDNMVRIIDGVDKLTDVRSALGV